MKHTKSTCSAPVMNVSINKNSNKIKGNVIDFLKKIFEEDSRDVHGYLSLNEFTYHLV